MQQTLFLMLGYPGAGKTTTAEQIAHLTGATHLWADRVRRERFGTPTYTHQENLELYDHLNEVAAELLNAGNSVVYDTNFNFYKDRERLRRVATQHGAQTVLVWVQTPRELAETRATQAKPDERTRVLGKIPPDTFRRMANNLEPPHDDELTLKIDGTKVTANYIRQKLSKIPQL
jgi:predicted kinase